MKKDGILIGIVMGQDPYEMVSRMRDGVSTI